MNTHIEVMKNLQLLSSYVVLLFVSLFVFVYSHYLPCYQKEMVLLEEMMMTTVVVVVKVRGDE